MRSLLVSLTVPFVYLFGAGIAPALWGVLGDAGRFDLGFVLLAPPRSPRYAASVARSVDDRR